MEYIKCFLILIKITIFFVGTTYIIKEKLFYIPLLIFYLTGLVFNILKIIILYDK
jgi:hypothetical protein